MVVTNKPQCFVWQGYGLKLVFPEGCLPAHTTRCTIRILASLSGQYQFPEDSYPVSAIFWLCCEPRCNFAKPVSMEIQHCAIKENISKLYFAKALCSPQKLPYCFKESSAPSFSKNSSYGVVELDRFSGGTILQTGSEDREYVAKSFHQSLMLSPTISTHNIDLVVTWNSEPHLTVSDSTTIIYLIITLFFS